MKIRSLKEAEVALARYIPNASKLGKYKLDVMRKVMGFLDNPQDKLRIIHVAGTSGKTSTSYYCAALLQKAGLKVGLTVSPHVSQINERVQVNLEPLNEAGFCEELEIFLSQIEKMNISPSYFECLTAFAFWEFHRQGLDYAVVEVGLGGLLDATNVISRQDKVCVITDIGLDHMDRLGSTLPEIATQKAGIIHRGNVVFCNQQAPEIMQVFASTCSEQQAELQVTENTSADLDFLPMFQKRNFNLALSAVSYILIRDGLPPFESQKILEAAHTNIPARMEVVRTAEKTVILDGAHNYQKLNALGESIRAKFPGQKISALISMVDGRGYRIESSLQALSGMVDGVIVTAFEQAAQDLPHGPINPEKLAELARANGIEHAIVEARPIKAYEKLLEQPEPILLITGSFFLMEDLRPEVYKHD